VWLVLEVRVVVVCVCVVGSFFVFYFFLALRCSPHSIRLVSERPHVLVQGAVIYAYLVYMCSINYI
jgi:hypothetical protein